jgi:hypothetical protein
MNRQAGEDDTVVQRGCARSWVLVAEANRLGGSTQLIGT